jgi:hypothetical protein
LINPSPRPDQSLLDPPDAGLGDSGSGLIWDDWGLGIWDDSGGDQSLPAGLMPNRVAAAQ